MSNYNPLPDKAPTIEIIKKLNWLLVKTKNIGNDLSSKWEAILEVDNARVQDPFATKTVGNKIVEVITEITDRIEALEAGGGGGGGDVTREELEALKDALEEVKGADWTNAHSIMSNYREILMERITPKHLHVEVTPEHQAKVSFSYEDSSHISHFILEYYDSATNSWKPYDGSEGIVNKGT